MGSLEAFIRPKSLAVVGASTSGNKAGGRRWLSSVNAGFSGPLYPINRTATEMNGHRVYRSLRDIPGPVDLVAVLVPPGDVMDCIRDCAAMKVGAVVVISAGFGEVDERGKAAECQMRDILGSAGVRMIGPNSAGVFSGRGGVNLLGTFQGLLNGMAWSSTVIYALLLVGALYCLSAGPEASGLAARPAP